MLALSSQRMPTSVLPSIPRSCMPCTVNSALQEAASSKVQRRVESELVGGEVAAAQLSSIRQALGLLLQSAALL